MVEASGCRQIDSHGILGGGPDGQAVPLAHGIASWFIRAFSSKADHDEKYSPLRKVSTLIVS
jgi:hypothetical protein